MAPKISVIMAAHNSERHLRKSVEGILDQTYTDFEFIIVEDGSTDLTWKMLTEYADRDRRIVLAQNKENLGLTKSLNRGLALAQGKYIARQDADDISLPERLDMQLGFLERNLHVGLLGTAYYVVDSRGIRTGLHRHPETDTEIRWQMLFHNAFCHTSVMFCRDVFDRASLFYDEALDYSQDYELWIRMLRRTCAANFKTPLVEWRKSDGAISSVRREEQQRTASMISAKQVNRLFPRKSISLPETEKLREFYHSFPQRQGVQQLRLSRQLVEILRAFAGQQGLDQAILKQIISRWTGRVLSALIVSRKWDAQTAGILVGLFRTNAFTVLLCLAEQAKRGLKREVMIE